MPIIVPPVAARPGTLTLLQIVRQACAEMGLPQPSSVVGSTDQQIVQMLALLQREGDELVTDEGEWPQLRSELIFNLVAGQDVYPFPIDYGRFIQQTAWDRSRRWPLSGPLLATEWQTLKSGITVTGPRYRFRLMENVIYVDPVPGDSDTLVWEYYRNTWCISAAGVPQLLFEADDDLPLLPSSLLVLGLKWRFLAAKGANYAEERDTYEKRRAREHARAGSSRPLPMNAHPPLGPQLISGANIPDTGYGT